MSPQQRCHRDLNALEKDLFAAGFLFVSSTGHVKYKHPVTGVTCALSASKPGDSAYRNLKACVKRAIATSNMQMGKGIQ